MGKKVILLVEDNPDDIFLTMRALGRSNLDQKVIIAKDGVEALTVLFGKEDELDEGNHLIPSLVLLDLKLPRISGLEVLKRIRQDSRTQLVPVVILTSSREQSDLTLGYSLGANSFIQKPVDYHKFLDAISQIGLYWLLLNESPPLGAGREANQ